MGTVAVLGLALGCGESAPITRSTCTEADQCAGTSNCYSSCMCSEQDRDQCSGVCPDEVPPELAASETIDSWRELQSATLELINEVRAMGVCCETEGCFRPSYPLTIHAALEAAAVRHATDMAQQGYLSHTALDDRTTFDRIRAEGFRGCFMGENIASGDFSPESLVDAWLASASHCANLVEPEFAFVGLALSADGMEPIWVLTLGG